jgi:hypothetical protein
MSGTDPYCGAFTMPDKCKKAIEKKKEELQEDPPEDLIWGYMKD